MLKFRKIFIIFIIYYMVIQSYLIFIEPNSISLDFFYRNIMFWIFYLIIANLFIECDNLLDFKLHMYRNKRFFLKESLKEISIKNLIISGGISILNCLMLVIIKSKFSITLFVYYFINLFFIIEIIYIYIFAFIFKRKNILIRCLTLIILLIMFNFGKAYIGITPINIFKYVIYLGNWYEIMTHYSIWLLGAYIMIEHNSKRVEV